MYKYKYKDHCMYCWVNATNVNSAPHHINENWFDFLSLQILEIGEIALVVKTNFPLMGCGCARHIYLYLLAFFYFLFVS